MIYYKKQANLPEYRHVKEVNSVEEDTLMMILIPEMLKEAQERYEILLQIQRSEPVGRHLLILQTGLSEKVVRAHLSALTRAGLIFARPSGLALSSKGKSLLTPLSRYFMKRPSSEKLALRLQEALSMERVILVRGDSATKDAVRTDVMKEAALDLLMSFREGDVIAVSGGPDIAGLVDEMPHLEMDVTIVPARGGFGKKLEYQPNVISAALAERIGGQYEILHIPDGFSPELISAMRKEIPDMPSIEDKIHHADYLLTGVYNAQDMALWHDLPEDVQQRLETSGAAGEALGVYADVKGKVLYRTYNVGVSLDEIADIPHVLIVAGGSDRALSILAMARAGLRGTLVTDEGAGNEILRMIDNEVRGKKFFVQKGDKA